MVTKTILIYKSLKAFSPPRKTLKKKQNSAANLFQASALLMDV